LLVTTLTLIGVMMLGNALSNLVIFRSRNCGLAARLGTLSRF
jgi:hypothetical protein